MSIYVAFNNEVEKFFNDVIHLFPEDTDFPLFKRGFSLVKRGNTLLPLKLFREYAKPYETYIDNRDGKFFMENSDKIAEHLSNNINDNTEVPNNAQYDGNMFELVDRLKKYWKDMSESNHDHVWGYMQNLLKLSRHAK